MSKTQLRKWTPSIKSLPHLHKARRGESLTSALSITSCREVEGGERWRMEELFSSHNMKQQVYRHAFVHIHTRRGQNWDISSKSLSLYLHRDKPSKRWWLYETCRERLPVWGRHVGYSLVKTDVIDGLNLSSKPWELLYECVSETPFITSVEI